MEIIGAIFLILSLHSAVTSDVIPQADAASKHQTAIAVNVYRADHGQAEIDKIRAIAVAPRPGKDCLFREIGGCMLATLDDSEKVVMQPFVIEMQAMIDRQAKSSAGNGYNPRRSLGYISPTVTVNTNRAFEWIAMKTQ